MVLSGAIAIVQPVGDARSRRGARPRAVHRRDQHAVGPAQPGAGARHHADGAVIAVDRDDLRTLVQRDSELSEILMRAFILRRVALVAQGHSDLVLLGSRHSAGTLRISEFLTRNGQPFTYQDVETDPGVQALLDRFHVGVNEVPVMLCRRAATCSGTRRSSSWPRRWA